MVSPETRLTWLVARVHGWAENAEMKANKELAMQGVPEQAAPRYRCASFLGLGPTCPQMNLLQAQKKPYQ